MKTHLRVWDIPLLNALPLAIALAVCSVNRSYVPMPDAGMVAFFELPIVRLFVGFPIFFLCNLVVGYLMCFAAKKWGFVVTASVVALLSAAAFVWSICRTEVAFVIFPLLAMLAKRMRDNDKVLNIIANVALLAIIGVVVYIIYYGRMIVEPVDHLSPAVDVAEGFNIFTFINTLDKVLVAGVWISYYLLPRYVMPGLYMLALVLLFAIVPAVSWQIFILPAFMLVMYWWYCKRYYIAFVVKKERRHAN